MKKTFLAIIFVLSLVSISFAWQLEVVGLIRGGLAGGLVWQTKVARNVNLRLGAEVNTGKEPIILFGGGKFYLANISRMPFSLGLSLVGYFGAKSLPGVGFSFIFDRFLEFKPLFLEVGVDVVGEGRLQAQLGYRIY
jgi:hypothetical protein